MQPSTDPLYRLPAPPPLEVRSALRQLAKRVLRRRWPHRDVSPTQEPYFLFILTPPYSGSTALAQVLRTCRGSAFLTGNAEGQWLVPGMCEVDRWNPLKKVDWLSVRSVWLERIEFLRRLVSDISVIIEKSPESLVRMDRLIDTFPHHAKFAFNRNPFANCASILYRHHDPERRTERQRLLIVRRLAEWWLFRSRWIRRWVEEWGIPSFSYEAFCHDPGVCVSRLVLDVPQLASVETDRALEVKDYKPQRLSNQNPRQIAKLSMAEIGAIREILDSDADLVEYFGYDAETSARGDEPSIRAFEERTRDWAG